VVAAAVASAAAGGTIAPEQPPLTGSWCWGPVHPQHQFIGPTARASWGSILVPSPLQTLQRDLEVRRRQRCHHRSAKTKRRPALSSILDRDTSSNNIISKVLVVIPWLHRLTLPLGVGPSSSPCSSTAARVLPMEVSRKDAARLVLLAEGPPWMLEAQLILFIQEELGHPP
jgi:hypothetical protein